MGFKDVFAVVFHSALPVLAALFILASALGLSFLPIRTRDSASPFHAGATRYGIATAIAFVALLAGVITSNTSVSAIPEVLPILLTGVGALVVFAVIKKTLEIQYAFAGMVLFSAAVFAGMVIGAANRERLETPDPMAVAVTHLGDSVARLGFLMAAAMTGQTEDRAAPANPETPQGQEAPEPPVELGGGYLEGFGDYERRECLCNAGLSLDSRSFCTAVCNLRAPEGLEGLPLLGRTEFQTIIEQMVNQGFTQEELQDMLQEHM